MASVFNISRPSIFPLSAELPTETVGSQNPIELPLIQINLIGQTIGKQIDRGGCGSIYNVKDSTPQRIYKIIPLNQLENGNEIRIAKIAAELGIAPSFYGACVVQQGKNKFVCMEMDYAGKSLGRWMEDLAQEEDINKAALIGDSSSQLARKKAMEALANMKEDECPYQVFEIEKTPKVSMEVAVDKLYKSREAFFFQLFSAFKKLAENNIAYKDSHCGNLIPNAEKGLQLIDFDAAALVSSPAEAADKVVQSMYNQRHLKDYEALKDLSSKSCELIRWFKTQQMDWLVKQFSRAV